MYIFPPYLFIHSFILFQPQYFFLSSQHRFHRLLCVCQFTNRAQPVVYPTRFFYFRMAWQVFTLRRIYIIHIELAILVDNFFSSLSAILLYPCSKVILIKIILTRGFFMHTFHLNFHLPMTVHRFIGEICAFFYFRNEKEECVRSTIDFILGIASQIINRVAIFMQFSLTLKQKNGNEQQRPH